MNRDDYSCPILQEDVTSGIGGINMDSILTWRTHDEDTRL